MFWQNYILIPGAIATLLCTSCALHPEYWEHSGYVPLYTIGWHTDYNEKTSTFTSHNDLEILSIQQIGSRKIIYPPVGERRTLWLQPGKYRAKIKCDRTPKDKDSIYIIKVGTPLGKDRTYTFNLKLMKPGFSQQLVCAVTANGQVYVALLDSIEVVGS